MRSTLPISFALLTLGLAGCPSTPADPDASTARADAPSGGGDIAACEALARTFRDNCAETNGATDVRVCLWERYAELCRLGNTALLLQSMRCLDDSTCRTFSDANEGNACLDALHAREQPAALRSVIEGQCTACGSSECTTAASRAEIFPYLLASDAPALDTCTSTDTCSVDSIVLACGEIAGLAPFTACAM